VEAKAKELECSIDRDMSRSVMRHVLAKTAAQLGGAEELCKSDGEQLIEGREKDMLSKRIKLLKKWLVKECDQAYALFAVQKLSQELGHPNGEWWVGGRAVGRAVGRLGIRHGGERGDQTCRWRG